MCTYIQNLHILLLIHWSLHCYIMTFFLSCDKFWLHVNFFFLNICIVVTPALFCLPFSWNIFFCFFTFSQCVSLSLSESLLQAAYWWTLLLLLCIYSITLCLLIGEYNLFTFKVVIDKDILFQFRCFQFYSSFVPFFLSCLSVLLYFFIIICLYSFFLSFVYLWEVFVLVAMLRLT